MTSRSQRFTRLRPCPVCGGHDGLARGKARRCFGYLDDTGGFARCTREEKAGALARNGDGTYSHRLLGRCPCGRTHGDPIAFPSTAIREPQGRPRSFRSRATLEAALRRQYGVGSIVRSWIYRDGSGEDAFRILRVDYRDAQGARLKTYRPCHQGEDGRWRLAKPAGLLPLYNLPAVCAAAAEAIVPVLEGEKCVEIAIGLGLAHATTSAHGAQAPQLTDWSPLAGRVVAILRDEGPRGAEYAAKVAAILAALSPPATVTVVQLPGLGDGEDIEQWRAIERAQGRSRGEMLARLRALIDDGLQVHPAGVYPWHADPPGCASASRRPIDSGGNPHGKESRMSTETTKPAHKIRSGGLTVTLWRRSNDKGDWYSAVPSRSYKQGDEWKETDNFGFDDLLPLAKLLDHAHTWMLDRQQSDQKARKESDSSAA